MASIAELAHVGYSITQSITHSPSLFNAPGTEAFTSEYAQPAELESHAATLISKVTQQRMTCCSRADEVEEQECKDAAC